MRQQRFNNSEQMALGSLDFYRYEDSVVRAIREWEISGHQWNDDIRHVQQAISLELFDQAEAELTEAQVHYAESFAAAASAVAADGHIPERIIPALDGLIHYDDECRREQLRLVYTRFDIKEPSEAYIYDLTMAFGDPDGVTLPYKSPYVVFDRSTATEYFASRLSDHAALVLDHRRLRYEQLRNQSTRRSLGSTAMNFVRRFGKRKTEDL